MSALSSSGPQSTQPPAAQGLTPEAQIAINNYLGTWLLRLGFVNFAAILVAAGYIFLVLPKHAAEEARAAIHEQSTALAAGVVTAAADSLKDTLKETARAQATAGALAEQTDRMKKVLVDLESKVAALDKSELDKAKGILDTLKSSPAVQDAVNVSSRVKAIEDRLAAKTVGVRATGYGNAPWSKTSKEATCPEGQVAVGVQVAYGGTCNRQCDGDGGVVREVTMICRPI